MGSPLGVGFAFDIRLLESLLDLTLLQQQDIPDYLDSSITQSKSRDAQELRLLCSAVYLMPASSTFCAGRFPGAARRPPDEKPLWRDPTERLLSDRNESNRR